MSDTTKTPFDGLTDETPKYTVKEVAKLLGMTAYTIRYYDNANLIPNVGRSGGNARLFSDHSLAWLKLIHCLRTTGLPILQVREYVKMCLKGDVTIRQRAQIIFKQEEVLRKQLELLNQQMEILTYKKHFYEELLAGRVTDICNPSTTPIKQEPNIAPKHV